MQSELKFELVDYFLLYHKNYQLTNSFIDILFIFLADHPTFNTDSINPVKRGPSMDFNGVQVFHSTFMFKQLSIKNEKQTFQNFDLECEMADQQHEIDSILVNMKTINFMQVPLVNYDVSLEFSVACKTTKIMRY